MGVAYWRRELQTQSMRQIQACSSLWHSRQSRQAQAQPQAPPHTMLLVQVAQGSKLKHSRNHHGRVTLGRVTPGRAGSGQEQCRAPQQTGRAAQLAYRPRELAYRSRGLPVRGSRAGHDHAGRRHSGRTPGAGRRGTVPSELRGGSSTLTEQHACVTKNKKKLVLLLQSLLSAVPCCTCLCLGHITDIQWITYRPQGCTFYDIAVDGLCEL